MTNWRDGRAVNRVDTHPQSPKTPHLKVAAFLSWRDNNPVTVCSIRRPRSRGFTLLEAAVTLGIFALIFTGVVSLLTQPLEFDRENETVDTLKALKRAIIGDPDVVSAEVRTDFGFVGPMGNIPPALSDLWLLGAQPTFTIDTNLKLGTGWTGPYIEPPALAETDALGLDAWGNAIVLDAVAGVSAATGQDYVARLISPGSDADTGTSDDLTVEIYETDTFATVAGYVSDSGEIRFRGYPSDCATRSPESPARPRAKPTLTGHSRSPTSRSETAAWRSTPVSSTSRTRPLPVPGPMTSSSSSRISRRTM